MATFPTYAEILFQGYSEQIDPSAQIVEMERGAPKRSVINSQVRVKMQCSLLFRSEADVAAFEAWYLVTLKRVGEFTMTHPRTLETINAWFENSSIGPLVPLKTLFRVARRDVVIEYLR